MRKEDHGTPTDNTELPSTKKLQRSAESPVEKEEPEFKVDLRIEGTAQDVILRCEERMEKTQEVVEKSEMARARNLFLKIWENRKLCEVQQRIKSHDHELCNIELYELGEISRTVQCHSCLKHIPEGLTFCSCGVCLRLDEETIPRINARFQALIVPCYFARVIVSLHE